MKQQVLMKASMTLPIIALIIFIALFVGVVVWSFMKRNQQTFKQAGSLPLQDGR